MKRGDTRLLDHRWLERSLPDCPLFGLPAPVAYIDRIEPTLALVRLVRERHSDWGFELIVVSGGDSPSIWVECQNGDRKATVELTLTPFRGWSIAAHDCTSDGITLCLEKDTP